MRAIALIFSFIALAGTYASAATSETEGPRWGGRIFTDLYAPQENTNDDPMNQVATTAWLQVEQRVSPSLKGVANLQLRQIDYSNANPLGTTTATYPRFESGLREGWMDYQSGGWQVKVGRQIIPWGKSDGINPTDFLTSKDLTFFNPDEEVKRLGATSFLIGWIPGGGSSNWNFTLVYTPLFTPTKVLVSSKVASSTFISLAGAETRKYSLGSGEGALKLSYAGNGWDFDLIGYSGWDHMPILRETARTGTPPAVGIIAGPAYRSQSALGTNFTWAGDLLIFRLESAYIHRTSERSVFEMEGADRIETVLGAERPLGQRFRIQTQFISKYFPTYGEPSDADALQVQLRKTNVLLHGEQMQMRMGGSLRLSYEPSEATGLSWEMFLLQYWSQESDYLAQPKATYKWIDGFQTSLGVVYAGGPEGEPLALMKSFNSIFMEARLVF